MKINKVKNYSIADNTQLVSDKPIVVEIGNPLETKGAGSCVIVIALGYKKNKECVGIAHVLADVQEFDQLAQGFDQLTNVAIIGGSDDWFSKPLFDTLVSKVDAIQGITSFIEFNPTDSNPNKVVDVYINEKAECNVRIRQIKWPSLTGTYTSFSLFSPEPPLASISVSPESESKGSERRSVSPEIMFISAEKMSISLESESIPIGNENTGFFAS